MSRAKRFPVRFLGRLPFWVASVAGLVLVVAAWYVFGVPAREHPATHGSWYLWSGVTVGALFAVACSLSLRKWSIKLTFFRRLGMDDRADLETLWSRLQEINRDIAEGRITSAADIRQKAERVLEQTHTAGVRRIEVETVQVEGREMTVVQARHKDPLGRLEPWVEIHAALGLVACIGVLFHADVAVRSLIGWLMLMLTGVVLVSGVAGLIAYRFGPPMLVKAHAGVPYEETAVIGKDWRRALRKLAEHQPEGVRGDVGAAVAGESRVERQALREKLLRENPEGEEHVFVRDALVVAQTRRHLLRAAAPSRRIDALMRTWKYIHVPSAILLLGVVVVHILSVIRY